jgi:hypothetical protein
VQRSPRSGRQTRWRSIRSAPRPEFGQRRFMLSIAGRDTSKTAMTVPLIAAGSSPLMMGWTAYSSQYRWHGTASLQPHTGTFFVSIPSRRQSRLLARMVSHGPASRRSRGTCRSPACSIGGSPRLTWPGRLRRGRMPPENTPVASPGTCRSPRPCGSPLPDSRSSARGEGAVGLLLLGTTGWPRFCCLYRKPVPISKRDSFRR